MRKIILVLCLLFLNLQAQEIQLQATSVTVLPFMESEVFHLINKNRAANLLKPLKWSSLPAHYARLHSKNMAGGLVPFGHQGSAMRYNALRTAIPSLTRFAENVAYNFGYSNPAQVAVNGWLASPGHYANIMGDYNYAGVGVAKNERGEHYFTQIFIKANPTQTLNQVESSSEQKAEVSDNPVQYEIE